MATLCSGSGSCSGERSLTRLPAASASGPGRGVSKLTLRRLPRRRARSGRACRHFHEGAQVLGDLRIDAEQARGKDQAIGGQILARVQGIGGHVLISQRIVDGNHVLGRVPHLYANPPASTPSVLHSSSRSPPRIGDGCGRSAHRREQSRRPSGPAPRTGVRPPIVRQDAVAVLFLAPAAAAPPEEVDPTGSVSDGHIGP